jgi:hypothetical protein
LSSAKVDIHELIAWGFDEYPYRSVAKDLHEETTSKQMEQAQQRLAEREPYVSCPALLAQETEKIKDSLITFERNANLSEEYKGLDWTLGVVDLRRLLAFQRRLVFDPASRALPTPGQDDWSQLITFAMGPARGTEHRIVRNRDATDGLEVSLHSGNPDLQLRLNPGAECSDLSPLSLYGGSPFFEVAEFHGRWFLRDGYHRAYRLLQAEVHRVPAVVIFARTIEELGATGSYFFAEDQLFSDRPPRVTDFLEDDLVLRYQRVAFRKVIRIRIEESLQPFDEAEEIQGEKI